MPLGMTAMNLTPGTSLDTTGLSSSQAMLAQAMQAAQASINQATLNTQAQIAAARQATLNAASPTGTGLALPRTQVVTPGPVGLRAGGTQGMSMPSMPSFLAGSFTLPGVGAVPKVAVFGVGAVLAFFAYKKFGR